MKRKWNFAIKLVWSTTFCSCFHCFPCFPCCSFCSCSCSSLPVVVLTFVVCLGRTIYVAALCGFCLGARRRFFVLFFSLAFLLTFCAHFIYMHLARDARQLIPHSLCPHAVYCTLSITHSFSLSLFLSLAGQRGQHRRGGRPVRGGRHCTHQ